MYIISVTIPYILTAVSVMETNNENRMGEIWGETAFKPSYIWNVLEIIRSKGFECVFLIHILHS